MIARRFLVFGRGIALALLMLQATAPTASAQTKLPSGLEIRLLPGFAYEPLQGIDSIVGLIAKKDGLKIQFEMGNNPPPGAPRFGGSFVNQALQTPEKDRLWTRETEANGRKIHVVYSKDQRLIISSATTTEGVNFHVTAKTPEEVADVLLMVLTLSAQKGKLDR